MIGQDPYLHNERFHSTLFGSENLFSLRLPHIIRCYYFHESAFFSWRSYLDGAILTYQNTVQLCINSLSARAERFRKSEIVLSMSKGLCDPQKLEESYDHVMIADCDIDRKSPDKVLNYLQEKYGLDHLQTIPMKQHTGTIKYQWIGIAKSSLPGNVQAASLFYTWLSSVVAVSKLFETHMSPESIYDPGTRFRYMEHSTLWLVTLTYWSYRRVRCRCV